MDCGKIYNISSKISIDSEENEPKIQVINVFVFWQEEALAYFVE